MSKAIDFGNETMSPTEENNPVKTGPVYFDPKKVGKKNIDKLHELKDQLDHYGEINDGKKTI
jgi:hypothetical protein